MTKLESVVQAAKLYREASVTDLSIIITDADAKVMEYLPDTQVKTGIKVGDIVSKGPVKQCIAERRKIETIIPEHAYGMRIKGTMIPIVEEDGQVSGMLGTSTTTKAQDTLHCAAQTIAATAQQLNATAEELAAAASQLAADLAKVRKGGELVLAEIGKTGDILKFVSDVAGNSNLLGLNAAIEAARAGEHGRGFAVVAEEIRKMAVNSAESVTEIKKILQAIHSETETVVKTITNTTELAERQAAATEEIAASMNNLASSASEVEKIAEVV